MVLNLRKVASSLLSDGRWVQGAFLQGFLSKTWSNLCQIAYKQKSLFFSF